MYSENLVVSQSSCRSRGPGDLGSIIGQWFSRSDFARQPPSFPKVIEQQNSHQTTLQPSSSSPASPWESRCPCGLNFGSIQHLNSVRWPLCFRESHLERVAPRDSLLILKASYTTLSPSKHNSNNVLLGESAVQDRALGSSLAVRQPRKETLQIARPTVRYPK